MLAERLDKAWRARRGSIAIDSVMRFSDEGLVLGAGTVLAKSGASGRDLSIDPSEPRFQALLGAAHRQKPTVGALTHLRMAADRWREGLDALAAMHLALSRLDRLEQPEADAHRLFLADGLLESGFEANAIIDAIEAGGSAFERLHKYNQDQPRVPAGSGRTSGEWTSGDQGSAANSQPEAEVNPSTITPALNVFHKDACLIARIQCADNTLNDSRPTEAANDNGEEQAFQRWRVEEYARCHLAFAVCEDLSFIVHYTPWIERSAVRYPDGGVVVSDKGWSEDLYVPRGEQGEGIPPMRR